MKFKDLKNKKISDLVSTLKEKRVALKDFNFGLSGSKIRNVKEGKGIKKDIARILTAIKISLK